MPTLTTNTIAVRRFRGPKTVALLSAKDGVGKTTLALNLGAALRKKVIDMENPDLPWRVVVVDCDATGTLGYYISDRIYTPTMSTLLQDLLTMKDKEPAEPNQYNQYTYYHRNSGLEVLVRPRLTELSRFTPKHMSIVLRYCARHYPLTIVDTQAGDFSSPLLSTILERSDYLLLVVTQHLPSLALLQHELLPYIIQTKYGKIGWVLNQHHETGTDIGLTLRQIRSRLDLFPCLGAIPYSPLCSSYGNRKRVLVTSPTNSKEHTRVVQAIEQVAANLMQALNAQEERL